MTAMGPRLRSGSLTVTWLSTTSPHRHCQARKVPWAELVPDASRQPVAATTLTCLSPTAYLEMETTASLPPRQTVGLPCSHCME